MAFNPYDPYGAEIVGIEQQRATARKLREEAMSPTQGQMVSGWYVAPNITQHLAKLLQGYTGAKGEAEAQKRLEDVYGRAKQEEKDWLAQKPVATTETSMSPYMAATPSGGRDYADITSPDAYKVTTRQPTSEDLAVWMGSAPGLSPSERGNIGLTVAKLREDKEFRQQQAKEKIDAEIQLAREKIASGALTAQQNREMQQRIAELQIEGKKDIANMMAGQKMVNVLGPNGESIMMPASEVGPGMERWTPQGAKAKQTEQKTGVAKNEVSDIVGTLSGSYNRLKELNAIPSTQNAAGTNLAAKLSSSGFGQVFGGALGTEAQSERDKIAQTRPLLLNAIKNATGMSAQQMNSNAELQLYLKAATDPTISFEANMKALENLDRLYGLGLTKGQPSARPMGSPTGISAPPPGAVRRIQ